MFKNILKKHFKLIEIIVIFILSLTPILWLKGSQIIFGHDAGFRLDPIQQLVNLFYSWDPTDNFGIDWSWFKGFLVAQSPEAIFYSLTKSLVVGQKLTFAFWFFSIGISMYIFVNAFFKEKIFWFLRIFSSTFYMFNFFLLQAWFIAERAKFSLFCAMPLGLLSIFKTLSRNYSLLKGAVVFSLVSFLFNAGGNSTFYGALLLIYGITFIYLTLLNIKEKGIKELIYSFKVLFVFSLGFIMINFYWIFPQIYSFASGYGSNLTSVGGLESIMNWESVITQNASFLNLFRLQGIPDWYDNNLHTYSIHFLKNPILIVASFIPLIILLYGLSNHYRLINDSKINKVIILFLFLLIFGFFFTAGSHSPFGNIYVLLMKYVPGFAIFRSAFYKFGGVLWFSYIFILSFYIAMLLMRFAKEKVLYVFFCIASIFLLLAYHFPFFNSDFFTWNKPFTTKLTVPDYVEEMTSYINKLPDNTRLLILPEFNREADSYIWGFWGVDSLPRLSTNKSIIVNSANYPQIVKSIYKSIEQKDQESFLRLTGMAGIEKILWRNDILYWDKKTTGKHLSYLKSNIENFLGVRLEKQSEEWSIYDIESQYYSEIFDSNSALVIAQSDPKLLEDIIDNNNFFVPILFSKSLENKDSKALQFANKIVIGAECVACIDDHFSKTKGGILMPDVMILPSSPFYYFISSKEKKIKEKYKNSPSQRIDADLGFSNKRIAEIKKLADVKFINEKQRIFVSQNIDRHKFLIKDALAQAELLPDNVKNRALMKISIYLNSQFWYLSIQKNLYDYSLEDFEEFSAFIQETVSDLGNKIWATNLIDNKIRYYLNVGDSGDYEISIKMDDGDQVSIGYLDGIQINDSKIFLEKGVHKIEIAHSINENLVSFSSTGSGELRLPFGQRVRLSFGNFDSREKYFISFDYKINLGRPNASVIEKSGKTQRTWNLLLNQNNEWNSFGSVFEPKKETESVELEFYPTGFETFGAMIQIKNLNVVRISIPDVFVSMKKDSFVGFEEPKITFNKLNPTMYKVSVENSIGSFILNFGETYNDGWKAYVINDEKGNVGALRGLIQTLFLKPIPEERHYVFSDYSNGWLLDQKGNFKIIVEYFPQKIFYLGVIISVATLFFITLLFLKKKI